VPLQTLSVEEVRRIHFALVEEFQSSSNPIFPPGVKSENLLASAVSRQDTSIGGTLKYPDPFSNAATLAFGICCDHPFHNGNKRTALVSLLAHLYKNRLSLAGVAEADLYNLVITISIHAVATGKKKSKHAVDRPCPDDEISAVSGWIRANSRSIQRGERQITYRQLRQILEHFGYVLKNPKGNAIDIYRREKSWGLLLRPSEVQIRIGSIPFPGDGTIVSVKDIKYVRKLCRLVPDHGVDTEDFYGEGQPLDAFIIQHRDILHRLASK
jgi:death-on-curing protein